MSILEEMAKITKPDDKMPPRDLLWLTLQKLNWDQQAEVLGYINRLNISGKEITLTNITNDQSYWLLQSILKRDTIYKLPIEGVKRFINKHI